LDTRLANRGLVALIPVLFATTLPSGAQPPDSKTNPPKTNTKDALRDSEWYGDEEPAHRVNLTHGFWLGAEVTQATYERVTRKNPSNFKGPSLSVEQVTYRHASGWAEAR